MSAAVPAAALPVPASSDVAVDHAVPGPPPVHPVVSDAAVDKSVIVYDPNPVAAATGTDIASGLLAAGVDPVVLDAFSAATRTIIGGESGGSVNAVNRWDSNAHGAVAADGAPGSSSRGPMQTIPGTFAAFHAPGTSLSIYDPRANIAAGWRYISAHYRVDLHTCGGLAAFMARGVGHDVGY